MITSRSNPTIQSLRALLGKKERCRQGAFLLEGPKLISEAAQSGIAIDTVVHAPGCGGALAQELAGRAEIIEASAPVVKALCDAQTPQGIAARARTPDLTPPAAYGGLWVALDAVQDPGNVGAIIRTADAMGARGVLLGTGCAEAYSPKTLRASMGSLFHMQIAAADLPAELLRMKAQGYRVLAGHLRGSGILPALPEKTVVLIGNEGSGLSNAVMTQADHLYRINIKGRAESLNAAAAAAILLYIISENR